jgi:uncharacterized phage protein gp47/JayE
MAVTVTLASLLGTYTESGFQTTQLTTLAAAGFPTTSWHETSVPRVLVKAHARATLDVANLVPQIAAGGLLDLAEGDWLTLLASSNYGLDRESAVSTRRVLRLTNTSGSQVDIAAGDAVKSEENLRFRAVIAGSIEAASGSTLDLEFEAEETGDAYDIDQTDWELVTAIAGVDVSEPVVTITRNGSDEESDDALRARCRERWSTLGAGANVDAYKYWAKNTPGVTESITRVQVRDSYPLPGQVSIYLATDDGAATSSYSFGTATRTGTGVPLITLGAASGYTEPQETFAGRVRISTGGTLGVAHFELSTDGGVTYSDPIVTAATYDVSNTGVRITFPAGTYVVNDLYSWTSTASAVTLVQNYIDPTDHLGKAPNCVDVIVAAASEYTLNLTGTITVSSATYKTDVENARADVLAEFVKQVDVGGVIRVAELTQRFMDLGGVIDCSFSSPASNVTLSAGQVCKAGTVSGLTVSA